MTIPFSDLKAQYASIKDEIDAAMAAVIGDCAFIQGPHVQRFETAFAARVGAQHCVGCSSGTSALTLALDAVGVGAGDEVVTVAHTFFATVEAVSSLGAVPVFVDVDPATHTMDPGAVERALTPRTRAIVPVHIYGGACDMDALLAIARGHGVKVVEDAAQAHLATFDGTAVGTMGDAGCFSFYPGKNLGAFGDAGAVVTDDEAVAERMRRIRDHGRTGKYRHRVMGYNHRMDGLQGAILGVKLGHLDDWTAARRRVASWYDRRLDAAGIERVRHVRGSEPVYHLYVVEVEGRDRVRGALDSQGIATGVHYPVPCHLQPAIGGLAGTLPVTEALADRVLSLPIYPTMTEAEVEIVCAALGRSVRAAALQPFDA